MKKFILGLVSFIVLHNISAQVINKDDRIFGGSFSFSIFNLNPSGMGYYNAGNAGIFPSFGWAIKSDLIFGIRGSAHY